MKQVAGRIRRLSFSLICRQYVHYLSFFSVSLCSPVESDDEGELAIADEDEVEDERQPTAEELFGEYSGSEGEEVRFSMMHTEELVESNVD